jgi:hypothetical protein
MGPVANFGVERVDIRAQSQIGHDRRLPLADALCHHIYELSKKERPVT